MNNSKNHSQLEEILIKLGYPENDILYFRKSFNQIFFNILGKKIENKLEDKEKEELAKMFQNPDIQVIDIFSYIKKIVKSSEIKSESQHIYQLLSAAFVEKLINKSNTQELLKIKNILNQMSS